MSTSWQGIAEDVAQAAPLLGTLIGGPAGAAVGGLVAHALGTPAQPDAVRAAVQSDPQAAVKLQQMALDNQVQLQQLAITAEQNRLAADTAGQQSVNGTMQVEDKSDHWPTYTWRPFMGFISGIMILGNFFVLPLLKLPVPPVPTDAWLFLGSVLGVASYFRGKAQANPDLPTDNRG